MDSGALDVPSFSLDDYCRMFALSDADRRLSILGCGDGPSSFNAEGTAQGMRIVSVDPLYRFRAGEIRDHIAAAARDVTATGLFLADYELGIQQGRYVTGDPSDLPFHDSCYDLALCSHQLFVNSEQLNLAFHLKALKELTRIAEEVRIVPTLEYSGIESRHLGAVMMALPRMGFQVDRSGAMLRITR